MDPSSDLPYVNRLERPVIGLEAEFRVFVDDVEVVPEEYWRTPQEFVSDDLVPRSRKSLQLPTGGALYFDGGVIEVVTPVIELDRDCTARVVRNLWEQVGYLRDQLDLWQAAHGKTVRLEAFSCHVNLSFELPRSERGRDRTVQKLALLLAKILPVPVIVTGTNRRSTGIGVRPRRDRIETTLDFTPDPGLMAATVALITGVTREVISWPSYRLEEVERRRIAVPRHLEPGKHPTRNGWIARAANLGHDPFAGSLDDSGWELPDGSKASLREIARRVAAQFRESIERYADPFSVKLLFSVLEGDTKALLDLPDQPPEYRDIGHAIHWGEILSALDHYGALGETSSGTPSRRISDLDRLEPPWRGAAHDRRRTAERHDTERRGAERRSTTGEPVWPELSRSAYESVFIRAARRTPLIMDDEELVAVAFHGWYHIEFATAGGARRELSIDQILAHGHWAGI